MRVVRQKYTYIRVAAYTYTKRIAIQLDVHYMIFRAWKNTSIIIAAVNVIYVGIKRVFYGKDPVMGIIVRDAMMI